MTSCFESQLGTGYIREIEVWAEKRGYQRGKVTYRKVFHGSYVFLGRFCGIVVRIIEFTAIEVPEALVSKCTPNTTQAQNLLRGLVHVASTTARHDLPDELSFHLTAADGLHHSQMLEIVVGLEKGISGEEFNQDAANTPNVAGVGPSKVENDFRGSIVSG